VYTQNIKRKFLRNAEFWFLSQATEFDHFRKISTFRSILQNLVLAGDKGKDFSIFSPGAAVDNYLLTI